MQARISRWGGSLALRIPKGAAEALGLREGDTVTIAEENGTLRIARSGRIDIERLIDAITPATLHRDDEWLESPAAGNEHW
jgi:antitoxin component of MazEF toxin-antitoxin module